MRVTLHRWRWLVLAAIVLGGGALLHFRFFRTPAKSSKRVYRIGRQQDAQARESVPNRLEGVSTEVMNAAALRSGIQLEWVTVPDGPDVALESGRVELWSLVTITPERLKRFHITDPWLTSDHVLLSLGPLDINKLSGGMLAFPNVPINRRLAMRFPEMQPLLAGGDEAAVQAVCRGQAKAALLGERMLASLLLQRPDGCQGMPFQLTRIPSLRTRLGVGSRFEYSGAANALRKTIAEMAEEGALTEILYRSSMFAAADVGMVHELLAAEHRSRVLEWSIGGLILLLGLVLWEVKIVRRARGSADRANAAKSQFLANMSHEIRTPLNGVIGMTELLETTALNADQREMTGVIQNCADILLALVNDVLDFAKIEAGRIEMESEPFDVHELVHQVCAVLRPKILSKGLTLSIEIDPALRSILGDSFRLRQVLTNLIANAVKFTESGGVRVEVKAAGDPGSSFAVIFRIIDSGIGISIEAQKRLFTPFTQADAATTRRYGGTGLGLAISRKLVQQMGGSIGIESELGHGATFWFILPLTQAPDPEPVVADAPEREPLAARGHDSIRVLIAEDNPVNQMVALRAVRTLGYSAETVSNGLEAVAAVAHGEFDLVLMDCQMPDMDGYQAAAEIRRQERAGRRIPIVAMTANAVDGDQQRCLAAGMDDYVTKPVRMAILAKTLERWIASTVRV